MQKENRIRLSKESSIFKCEYQGEYNELPFTIIHEKYLSEDGEPIELVHILWEEIVPKRDDLEVIEKGIKEMFKKKIIKR